HVLVVWVGRDDNGSTGLTGATGALPIFTSLVTRIGRRPLEPLSAPGLVGRRVGDHDAAEGSGRCRGVVSLMPPHDIVLPRGRCRAGIAGVFEWMHDVID